MDRARETNKGWHFILSEHSTERSILDLKELIEEADFGTRKEEL